jgi:hypothetical protein
VFTGVIRELGRASRLLGSKSRREGDRHKQHPGARGPTRPADEPTPARAGRDTKQERVNLRYRKGVKSEPTGTDEGSRSNAQYRGAGGNLSPKAWGTEAQGTHDKTRKNAGRQCLGMTSVPRKGRRDFEPGSCLNVTGAECEELPARKWASWEGSSSHVACGLVSHRLVARQGHY